MHAAEEVSDQVCAELLSLGRELTPETAAKMALAMVLGSARAYRALSKDRRTDREVSGTLLDSLGEARSELIAKILT